MKKSTKLTILVGLTMLFLLATSAVAFANAKYWIKAPLAQDVGIVDKPYSEFTEADCRSCHDANTVDRHHMSPTALDTSDPTDPTKGCIGCHEITAEGTIATPIVRTCSTCHETSWHHTTDAALAGTCIACHDKDILAEQGTGLVAPEKPTYDKSDVTPAVKDCANCHNDFNPDWNPELQVGSPDTRGPNGISHHGTGLKVCGFCHDSSTGPVGNILDIRMCESCHTITSLHTITQHTDNNNKCVGCHGTYMTKLPQLNPQVIPAITGLDTNVQKSFGYVVISGSNFGDSSNFGVISLTDASGIATRAYSSYWTNEEIRIMVPDKVALGNYNLKVTVNGKASNITPLTVVANPAITGISPSMGLASTTTTPAFTTLQGTSFATGSNLAVNFVQGSYKAAVVPQQNANGDLVVKVPVGMRAGKYLVNVSTSIGTSNTVYYTVGTAPKINLVSPTSARVGATVTMTGSNLSIGSKPTVKFGGVAATVKSYSATKLYVTVPSLAPGATTIVVNNGFADSAPAKFTVK